MAHGVFICPMRLSNTKLVVVVPSLKSSVGVPGAPPTFPGTQALALEASRPTVQLSFNSAAAVVFNCIGQKSKPLLHYQ